MTHELTLTGLNGANPLAFLAALGTLRTISRSNRAIRMHWRLVDGSWRPVLSSSGLSTSTEAIVELVHAGLSTMKGHPALTLADDLSVSPAAYRAFAMTAALSATAESAIHAEFAAAFASESVTNQLQGKEPVVEDTALRTMSGAGHQHFLGFMRELVEISTANDIRLALFEEWRYQDGKPSMRWDPEDDRRYALRWREPSGDPIRTVRGANRLAIEAVPLLPVMPSAQSLETTGFVTRGSRGTFLTWPIWEPPISISTVRSVLTLRSVHGGDKLRSQLARRGVIMCYRSQRLTVGKYRNFTMGEPV